MDAECTPISTAGIDDLPDVLALVRQCELLEDGVAEAIADFMVARSSGKLLGCAGLETHGNFGLLRSVAVDEPARKLGLGSKLVAAVTASARTRGLSELFLLTTSAPGFFERRGFHAVERSAAPAEIAASWEFRAGCPQAAVAMRLELKESRP